MRKHLLTLTTALLFMVGAASAQSFEWGTATWNIQDGTVYDGIDQLNAEGIVLTYPNPTDYTLTMLNMVAVNYNLYVDDATEPIKASASARGNTVVRFDYDYVEGHSYKIETTGALLAQVNLATFSADTLSTDDTSYTISFVVKGPELVKTIEVEGTMALTIVDQNTQLTYSALDTQEITQALGIDDISQAMVYGLNLNGSYNIHHGPDYYDGWRDADGEYTLWGGGYNTYAGHNAYPAVYCIKITPQADSIYYFFYDYWKLYDPNDPGEQGGSGIVQSRNRAPETSYHTILWDWDNGDGTTTTYTRFYRCDEGKDYKASFAVVANKRMVRIDATLHFVSQDDYAAYLNALNGHVYNGYLASGIAMMQAPGAPVQQLEEEQTVTISNPDEEGRANVIFSGFTMPMFASPTGELTIPVTVTKNADGSTTYEASDVVVGIARGQMVMNYVAALTGKQDSDEATPVITLTLTQATVITAVFAETSAKANEVLDNHYTTLIGITAVRSSEPAAASYGLDGTMLTAPRKGVVIQRQADGTMRKVLMAR